MKLKMKTFEVWGCGQYNQGFKGTVRTRTKHRAEKKLGSKFMDSHILKEVKK